jgi:hypothetical protein
MVALPFCQFGLLALRPRFAKYPNQISSLGDHIRVRRMDLQLLQMQVSAGMLYAALMTVPEGAAMKAIHAAQNAVAAHD